MDWTMVGALGELAGAAAVVASLLYVGRQVKQNTSEMRGARYHGINTTMATIYSEWADSERIPGLIERFRNEKVRASDFEPEDLGRIRLLMWAGVRILEDIFRQVEEGTLPRDAIDLLGGTWFHLPIFRDIWPHMKRDLAPDFARFMEQRYDLLPAATLSDGEPSEA